MLLIILSRPYGLTARRTGMPPDNLSNVSHSKYHREIVIREDRSRINMCTGGSELHNNVTDRSLRFAASRDSSSDDDESASRLRYIDDTDVWSIKQRVPFPACIQLSWSRRIRRHRPRRVNLTRPVRQFRKSRERKIHQCLQGRNLHRKATT